MTLYFAKRCKSAKRQQSYSLSTRAPKYFQKILLDLRRDIDRNPLLLSRDASSWQKINKDKSEGEHIIEQTFREHFTQQLQKTYSPPEPREQFQG